MIRLILALLNLLGFPGIGTLLAGHKRTGLIQLALAFIGGALTLLPILPIIHIVSPYLSDSNQLTEKLESGELISLSTLVITLLLSLIGIFIFSGTWLWSSVTTAPRKKTPPPLPGSTTP